jgi:hypothetical protein
MKGTTSFSSGFLWFSFGGNNWEGSYLGLEPMHVTAELLIFQVVSIQKESFFVFTTVFFLVSGTMLGARWLRHYATDWKVAGSSPG